MIIGHIFKKFNVLNVVFFNYKSFFSDESIKIPCTYFRLYAS